MSTKGPLDAHAAEPTVAGQPHERKGALLDGVVSEDAEGGCLNACRRQ